MDSQTIGLRFQNDRQYFDLLDEMLASISSPLMNGLPAAKTTRELIGNRRLFYIKKPDYLLIFCLYDECWKLYYIARENTVLVMPETELPIIAGQERLDTRQYPGFDALMERSAFTLKRIDVAMERTLDDNLKRETYVREEYPPNITAELAVPGDLLKIDKLLRSVYNPALDEIPDHSELCGSIRYSHVFVVRDHEKIAAAVIRIPSGSTAILQWIVVDPEYRDRKLSGLLHYTGDLDSKNRGYRRVVVWVNKKADGWIHAIEKRGYLVSRQRFYSYIYNPQKP